MTLKSCCNRKPPQRVSKPSLLVVAAAAFAGILLIPLEANAGDEAPQWVHSVASAPLPAHDDATDAVLLYEEENLKLISANSLHTTVRRVYKILRPGGRDFGYVGVPAGPHRKVVSLRGWCVPANGKDYQVKNKEAVEMSLSGVAYSELVNDVKEHIIRIPAAGPGSVIGYEYELEEQPVILQDVWEFQTRIPARETRYSIELPSGWSYQSKWINYPEAKPAQESGNRWAWTLADVKQVRDEAHMRIQQLERDGQLVQHSNRRAFGCLA